MKLFGELFKGNPKLEIALAYYQKRMEINANDVLNFIDKDDLETFKKTFEDWFKGNPDCLH